jgi:hypothetical protein
LARLLGLLFNLDHLFALIISAVRANVMRSAELVTIRTFGQVRAAEREMAAPPIAAAFG